jgi:hypothetical protein
MAMLVAGTALLWLAGCADPSGRHQVVSPNAPSTDDLVATCGDVKFDTIPADPSSFPPVADIASHVDLPALRMEAGMFREYDWFIARESRRTVVLFGVPPEPPELGPPYASAALRRDGDRWEPRSWGQCRVEVSAPGWGSASFVLDPARAPDPSADRILVSAWENACASGQAPDGRKVRAVLLDADQEAVSIVVLVEPVRGGADCPGNPSFPLEVELDGPLGERTVYDASVDPSLVRPWPPTDRSLESHGMDE